MKLSIFIIKGFVFYLLLLFAQVNNVYAQDCGNYYYMTNNAEVEMTIYDKNGAKSGLQTWKISNVIKDGDGFRSTINSTFTNEKGEAIAKGTGVYRCSGES